MLKALREKRGQVVAELKALNDKAHEEKRAMTAEEEQRFDALFNESEDLNKKIERSEKIAEIEREVATRSLENPETATPKADGAMEGFRSWLSNGIPALQNSPELRALQADVDVSGGYIVTPEQFVNKLIKALDNQVFMRPLANVMQITKADSLGAPTIDADPDDADWTSEIQTGRDDTGLTFGKRSLTPHPLAKRIKVSNKLLRLASMSAEDIVLNRLAYKFAIAEEKAFLTGSGSQQPLGVFTASSLGISVSRDVATANTTTAMTADGLINAKYSLKAQYQKIAQWLFHRDGVKQIAKLKDGDGQYLWQPSLQAGQPDMLLGRPVNMSEYAPNTFTTGQYVGMFADFSNYWIAESLQYVIQRLAELYAESNQVGFIGRQEVDGMPVLEEAFARVTLA